MLGTSHLLDSFSYLSNKSFVVLKDVDTSNNICGTHEKIDRIPY